MKKFLASLTFLVPMHLFGVTLEEKDLSESWVPSEEIPRAKGVTEYALEVNRNFSATYRALDKDLELECEYKPSSSQASVFVWYCYKERRHLVTLSLAGWSSELGKLLYGYEYWLGQPAPGEIYGGIPVSLEPVSQ